MYALFQFAVIVKKINRLQINFENFKNVFYNMFFYLFGISKERIFVTDNLNNLFALKTNTY